MNLTILTRRMPAILAAVLAIAIGSFATIAGAQSVNAGANIYATLTSNDINTKSAQVGDAFTMRVIPPYPNDDSRFENALIHGHVASVRSAGQGRTAQLNLQLDNVVLQSGESGPVQGSVVALDKKTDNTTARKALGAGAGAAVGSQTVGRLLGGTLGSVVGLAGGAAAGYAYGKNNKPNFDVARGAKATIQTSAPLVFSRRQQ